MITMRNLFFPLVLIFCTLPTFAQSPHQKFQAVPFTAVHFDDSFWSPRLKTNREVSIPHNYEWCENTERFDNFSKVAGLKEGRHVGLFFNDSDAYKLLEGTAYSLMDHPDPELEKRADAVIDLIAAAQAPNGYLHTHFMLRAPDRAWTDYEMHELYCAGHLIEAAIAYKQATGKDKLLDVTKKFVDHIIDVFGPEKKAKFDVPGHPEIELALVKLYEFTGEKKYLDLAKQFIDDRGGKKLHLDRLNGLYSQDHLPVREQSEAVGHAVRAGYLYAGMADIVAHTGDEELLAALNRLWDNAVNKKMYITGGIGAVRQWEAFGENYRLPNRSAYAETCAAISLVFWAHRMNLLTGDARYVDVLERALYNGVLAGFGMDGKSFFYVNPLESVGNHHRQPFFDCACCPINVIRFVPSLPGYQYATEGNTIYVNLFASGTATLQLPDGEVTIHQKTNYPWDGDVIFTFDCKPKPGTTGTFDMKIRQPQWLGTPKGDYSITVYVSWQRPAGEHTHTMKFPLQIRRMISHPNVVTNRGRIAIQRGPLVYCFEQVDNEVPIAEIQLARDPEFKEEFKPDLLGGIVVLKCKNADGRELTAIPYYAWNHREPGAMAVWVRQEGLPEQQPPDTKESLYAELKPEMLTE